MAAGFFPYTDYTRYMIKSGEEIIKNTFLNRKAVILVLTTLL